MVEAQHRAGGREVEAELFPRERRERAGAAKAARVLAQHRGLA